MSALKALLGWVRLLQRGRIADPRRAIKSSMSDLPVTSRLQERANIARAVMHLDRLGAVLLADRPLDRARFLEHSALIPHGSPDSLSRVLQSQEGLGQALLDDESRALLGLMARAAARARGRGGPLTARGAALQG